jgi:hypothetical protein
MSTTTQSITPSQNTVSYSTMNTDLQGLFGQSFTNRIINGNMAIAQRGTGAVSNDAAINVFPVDRFGIYGSVSSKFTGQQNAGSVTPPVGFSNYLGCTSSSAYSVGSSELNCAFQLIEGFNSADLGWGTANAKTVTLSFWVRSSLTGTFGGSILNSAFDRSYPFSYTISAANTWEQKSVTIAGDTTGTWVGATNGIGIRVFFNLGSGSSVSGTAGAWAAGTYYAPTGAVSVVGTNAATWYVTGVQLEVGSTATSFDYRPYGTELQLCQRYYEKSYDIETAPASNTSVGLVEFGSSSYTNSVVYNTIFFKATKRTAPTVTPFINTGTSGQWTYSRSGVSDTNTAVTATSVGQNSFVIRVPVGAAWVVVYLNGHFTASAEL